MGVSTVSLIFIYKALRQPAAAASGGRAQRERADLEEALVRARRAWH